MRDQTPDAAREDEELRLRDGELRMNAYYYAFGRTGVVEVDRILSAVACAGKGCHNTADWGEFDYPEMIQQWADKAAKAFRDAATVSRARDAAWREAAREALTKCAEYLRGVANVQDWRTPFPRTMGELYDWCQREVYTYLAREYPETREVVKEAPALTWHDAGWHRQNLADETGKIVGSFDDGNAYFGGEKLGRYIDYEHARAAVMKAALAHFAEAVR